jgi:hypothetical protein
MLSVFWPWLSHTGACQEVIKLRRNFGNSLGLTALPELDRASVAVLADAS